MSRCGVIAGDTVESLKQVPLPAQRSRSLAVNSVLVKSSTCACVTMQLCQANFPHPPCVSSAESNVYMVSMNGTQRVAITTCNPYNTVSK